MTSRLCAGSGSCSAQSRHTRSWSSESHGPIREMTRSHVPLSPRNSTNRGSTSFSRVTSAAAGSWSRLSDRLAPPDPVQRRALVQTWRDARRPGPGAPRSDASPGVPLPVPLGRLRLGQIVRVRLVVNPPVGRRARLALLKTRGVDEPAAPRDTPGQALLLGSERDLVTVGAMDNHARECRRAPGRRPQAWSPTPPALIALTRPKGRGQAAPIRSRPRLVAAPTGDARGARGERPLGVGGAVLVRAGSGYRRDTVGASVRARDRTRPSSGRSSGGVLDHSTINRKGEPLALGARASGKGWSRPMLRRRGRGPRAGSRRGASRGRRCCAPRRSRTRRG